MPTAHAATAKVTKENRKVASRSIGRVSAYRNTPRADPAAKGWLPHPEEWWPWARSRRGMPVPFVAMVPQGAPEISTPALRLRGVRKIFEAADDEQIPGRALRGSDLEVASGAFV